MISYDHAGSNSPLPGSPPDLTGSKSSKSSSFHSSYQSDDNTILSDVGDFEDIGLDDESRAEAGIGDFAVKTTSNPYDATYAADLRSTANQRKRLPMSTTNGNRAQRELIGSKGRPSYPSLRGQIRNATDGLGLLPITNNGTTMPRRGFVAPSAPSLPMMKRNRSSSPNTMRSNVLHTTLKTRRGNSQANRERKTVQELEKECDELDDDDVPDECFLENVPISPRTRSERIRSVPASASTSPERATKSPGVKVRSVGNGTSPRPAEQGELRSPKPGLHRGTSMGQFPINYDIHPKGRAKSWTSALSELSEEAKALTEALEAHAQNEEQRDDPRLRRSYSSAKRAPSEKARIRSAIAELPPLRRTDIMIDPLPISKEKEAVLSRTRPSWLPPKNPAEEKRHLKEYQKMMASALEAERRKEEKQKAQVTCRDDTANSLLRIWEEHVLPNWDEVTSSRNRRARELWWRGVAPRSRGVVWAKAIGNELDLSDSSYAAALRRARALEATIKKGSGLSSEEERKKGWLDRIERDVGKTYPELKIFQKGGPLNESLLDVLKAYAMYRSDVGYVPGTSTMAALLLLNLPSPSSSFCALSNILNRPLPLSFHTCDSGATSRAYTLLLSTLKLKSPRLQAHLTSEQLNLHPEDYMRDWFTAMGTEHLSLDHVSRLWDVMVFEGDALVVRAAVAFLTGLEGRLFGCERAQQVMDVVKEGIETMGKLDEDQWMNMVRGAGKS